MKNPKVTIVTACDVNYLWGVFLLTASIHRQALPVRVLFCEVGFDEDNESYISQFPEVEVKPLRRDDPYSLNNRKAEAMLMANSDYVAWVDADCLVVDSIADFLIPTNEQIQIRLRKPAENATVFERYYERGEKWGSIPINILKQWQRDVGDRLSPKFLTTCPSNCFIIHSRFLTFIEEWDNLIRKVVDSNIKSPLNRNDPTYWMTDESVLNALLLFSSKAPEPGDFRLDNLKAGHVVHFIGSPKPWVGWNSRFLYCLPKIVELLEWLNSRGFRIPPIPPSFSKGKLPYYHVEANVRGMYQKTRVVAGRILRSIGKRQ